jgi:tRNA threonylcarbamoyladenosine biosynthesis protein TsaE
MARLSGCSTADIQNDRIGHARSFARRHGVYLVLKGAATIVAQPDGIVFVNATGNPGMASGGMGDVLTGLIAGLITQGMEAGAAACAGVYLHGSAADRLARRIAPRGYLATEVMNTIPQAVNGFLSGNDPFLARARPAVLPDGPDLKMNAIPPHQEDGNARIIHTRAKDQTVALGQAIGRRLNHGLVLLLFGDLGSGKTAFAQGLARGADVPDSFTVTSPTYTLVNEYPGRLPFYHVDLYRLPEPVDPDEIGLMDIFEENAIVAVEWARRLDPADHPPSRLDLFFSVTGDTTRSVRIIAYGLDLSDLLNDIDI